MQRVKIIFFGDSLTQCALLHVSKSWPNLCQKAIKQKFPEVNFNMLNQSVCGENTRQALERMQQQVQIEEPDIVTIQFGANDSDYWLSNRGVPVVSEKAFQANLLEMIERAQTFGVQQIILHTNHKFFKHRVEINKKTHNENLSNYNQMIRNVAKEHHCALVDMFQELSGTHPGAYTLPPPDGIHLNEFGCQLYAQALIPVLEKCINSVLISNLKGSEQIPC